MSRLQEREKESPWIGLLISAAAQGDESKHGPFAVDAEIVEALIREWSPYWVAASGMVN